MIGADFQSLVTTHEHTNFASLLVLEQSNISRSSLFPFFSLSLKSEELCATVSSEESGQKYGDVAVR